jgi:hypothetical protein
LGAFDGDGEITALAQGTLDQRLLPSVPIVQPGFDARLNKTGSLLYTTGTDGGRIAVSDAHNGGPQLQLAVQKPNQRERADHPNYRCAAPAGHRPIGFKDFGRAAKWGGLLPVGCSAAGGGNRDASDSVGRRSDSTAWQWVRCWHNGGKAATCGVVDSETLSCTVPNLVAGATAISLTNPDGQTYSFENALAVQ